MKDGFMIKILDYILKENATLPLSKKMLIAEVGQALEYHEVSDELIAIAKFIINEDIVHHRFDLIEGYDGCTAVPDNAPHVSLACWVHDYLFREGYSLRKANSIFYKVMGEIHKGNLERSTRWLGVTLASPFFHFRNVFSRGRWRAPKIPKVFEVYLDD